EDLREVAGRDVLARVGARHEVDDSRPQTRVACVARGEVVDPEARLELRDRGDRVADLAYLPSRGVLELRAEPVECRHRLVHELDPGAWPDVDHDLASHSEQRVREGDGEVPARAELEERRFGWGHARPVLFVQREMVHRAGELLAIGGVADRKRMENVS